MEQEKTYSMEPTAEVYGLDTSTPWVQAVEV